jgi:hypothetical protein
LEQLEKISPLAVTYVAVRFQPGKPLIPVSPIHQEGHFSGST